MPERVLEGLSAGAGAIAYADVSGMWGRLHPKCRKNSVWLASSDVTPQLMQMVDSGNHRLWYPGLGSVAGDVPERLFGRPILYVNSAPALGSTGDLVLADLSFYVVALRQDIQIDKSEAVGWSRDVMSFRIVLRVDGQPMLSGVCKLENGRECSPFVVLQ